MSEELIEDLKLIIDSIKTIDERLKNIKIADDLVSSPFGLMVFDSIIIRLLHIGELIKNIDKFNPGVLKNLPNIEWDKIIRLRDLIAHHYDELDHEIIFDTCKNKLPQLKTTVEQIIKDNK